MGGTMKHTKLLATAFGVAVAGAISFGAQAEDMMASTYEIVDGTIPQSLTGKAGDPVAGQRRRHPVCEHAARL